MSYIQVKNPRNAKVIQVSFEPRGFKLSYSDLHKQTPISLYALAKAEGTNNFDNPLARAMEAFYKQRGKEWYGLITRDVVEEGGRGVDDKGRLHLEVTSFDGIKGWQRTRKVWAPKSGYPVPTADSNGTFAGLFQEGTPVPYDTVDFEKYAKAKSLWEAKGLDPKYLSGVYREERIDKAQDDGKRFVGRAFRHAVGGGGRFHVGLDRLPSNPGDGWVASLPPYESTSVVKIIL